MNKFDIPFKECLFFRKWPSSPIEKQENQRKPSNSALKTLKYTLLLLIAFISINLNAQIEIAVSNDTIICEDEKLFISATLTEAEEGVPNLPLVIFVQGANPSRFPETGSGSTLMSGTFGDFLTFKNPGKDSVIFIVETSPGVNLTDTVFVTTFAEDANPVAKAKGEFCVYLDEHGDASITRDSIDDGSIAPCGLADISINKSTFNCDDATANPIMVTLSVLGTNGEKDHATTEVYVKDTLAPVIECNPEVLKLGISEDGKASIDSAFLADNKFTFGDNCGDYTVRFGTGRFKKLQPGCDKLGQTLTRKVIVEDAFGNADSCFFKVEIIDNINPEITCSEDIYEIFLNADGIAEIPPPTILPITATDNCTDPGDLVYELSDSTFTCYDLKRDQPQMITLTVTDESGNKASCQIEVEIKDAIAPIITCKDTTIALDKYGNAQITIADLVVDTMENCPGDLVFSFFPDSLAQVLDYDCTQTGANPVTVYVTDAAGNQGTCMPTVTLIDTLAPFLACIDSIEVFLDENGVGSITVEDVDVNSEENCDLAAETLSLMDFDCNDIGNDALVTVLTKTDNATIPNTSMCTVPVKVRDTIAPVIECLEDDYRISLGLDGTIEVDVVNLFKSATDACGYTPSASRTKFSCSTIGTNLVTVTVEDPSGNKSTCVVNVIVRDNTAPNVECVDNLEVQLGTDGTVTLNPDMFFDATNSSDNCAIGYKSISPSVLTCDSLGMVEVELTVEDLSGNKGYCTTWVRVTNNAAPVANCTNPLVIYVDEDGNASIDAEMINDGSTVGCGLEPMLSISDGKLDYTCDDIQYDTLMATLRVDDGTGAYDECTTTVTVLDTIAPDVVCRATVLEVDILANGIVYIDPVFIDDGSSDNCGGVLTRTVSPSSFTCDDFGLQTVTLTVTDESGNASSCTASVMIRNESPPEITCKDATVYLDASGMVIIDETNVIDQSTSICSGDLTFEFERDTFFCDDIGTVVDIKVTATAPNGKSDYCHAEITVLDTIAPTLTCKAPFDLYLDAWGFGNLTPADLLESVYDACDDPEDDTDDVVLEVIMPDINCTDAGQSVEVILKATDEYMNMSQCTTTVHVLDTIPPSIICPIVGDTVISPTIQCKAPFEWDMPVVDDKCGVKIVRLETSPAVELDTVGDKVTGIFKGTTVVTYGVEDVNGNVSICTFRVMVEDKHAPTFGSTCPSDKYFSTAPGECGIPYEKPGNIVPQDNCIVDRYVCTYVLPDGTEFSSEGVDGSAPSYLPIGETKVSHYVVDEAGNEAFCEYSIFVTGSGGTSLSFNDSYPGITLSNLSDGDTLYIPNQDTVPIFTSALVDANDCSDVEITFEDFGIYNNGCENGLSGDRVFRCVWTATDLDGNTSQIVLFIKVLCPTTNTPDLQPNFKFGQTSFQEGQSKMVIININEINDGPTTGPIRFFLPNSTGFTYSFDATQTSATIFIPNPVDNPDWSVQTLSTGLLFTSTETIPAKGVSRVGIRVTSDIKGSKASMTVNLSPNAGGESRTDNNVAVLDQSVQN